MGRQLLGEVSLCIKRPLRLVSLAIDRQTRQFLYARRFLGRSNRTGIRSWKPSNGVTLGRTGNGY